MSKKTLESSVLASARSILCNSTLKNKDLTMVSSGPCGPTQEGEVVVYVPDSDIYISVKKEKDKRIKYHCVYRFSQSLAAFMLVDIFSTGPEAELFVKELRTESVSGPYGVYVVNIEADLLEMADRIKTAILDKLKESHT